MPRFEKVKYVGDGTHYIVGVPTRDLDADEWYALSAETRENALRLKLYEGVGSGDKDEKPAPVAVVQPTKAAEIKPAGGGS